MRGPFSSVLDWLTCSPAGRGWSGEPARPSRCYQPARGWLADRDANVTERNRGNDNPQTTVSVSCGGHANTETRVPEARDENAKPDRRVSERENRDTNARCCVTPN